MVFRSILRNFVQQLFKVFVVCISFPKILYRIQTMTSQVHVIEPVTKLTECKGMSSILRVPPIYSSK